jgi:competence protein ComEC
MAFKAEAFAEDCARAAVVVSRRDAPIDCAATLIDRKAWRAHGSTALRWTGDHFEETFARPHGIDRPWARAVSAPAEMPSTSPRDATPKQEDLEAGD